MSSVEDISERTRLLALATIAPLAWGTTYVITATVLPPDRPLFSAAMRALPAGLVLLAVTRTLPPPGWRLKAVVLGLCNIGLFFPLVFLGAYRLPGGLAATLQAVSPLVVMALAVLILGERPGVRAVLAGLVGLLGVGLLVLRAPQTPDALGLAGALGSVLVSGLGFVLVRRWRPPVGMLTLVSWQLVVGGVLLVPLALLVEGAPPALDAPAVAGYLWLGGVATVLAYVCWFSALSRLPAGNVALVGLLNPVMGTVLGVAVLAESFGPAQAVGTALVVGSVLAARGPASADGDLDGVRGLPAVGVDDAEPVLADLPGLDVGGEGAVADHDRDVEVLPGARLQALDLEDGTLALRVGAAEVDALHRADGRGADAEVDALVLARGRARLP